MTDVDAGLKRALGPVSATCIVIGAIVGVGIFFTPSRVAAVTGSAESSGKNTSHLMDATTRRCTPCCSGRPSSENVC